MTVYKRAEKKKAKKSKQKKIKKEKSPVLSDYADSMGQDKDRA